MNRPFAHLCELPEYGGHTDVESSGVYAEGESSASLAADVIADGRAGEER